MRSLALGGPFHLLGKVLAGVEDGSIGSSVDQSPVSGVNLGNAKGQEMSSHTLEQGGGTRREVQLRRQLHQEPRRDHRLLGVRAPTHGAGHPIPHSHLGYSWANGPYYPGCFSA